MRRILVSSLVTIALLLFYAQSVLAACTSTRNGANYGADTGANSATVSVNNAVGDLIVFAAFCYSGSASNCSGIGTLTLGGQTATVTPNSGNSTLASQNPNSWSGQGWIYYITAATSGGPHTATWTVTGAHSDIQLAYMSFTPSASCGYVHHLDAFAQFAGDSNTGQEHIGGPSITDPGALLYNFTWTSAHIDVISSPWICVIYANSFCTFDATVNTQAYVLAAGAGATANSMTENQGTNSWQALITSFTQVAVNTHYISTSTGGASDSNNGTAKATPWLHTPGMPGCTANCASYVPQAGDNFILKGGDTWPAASLGINWQWNGTTSQRIYIGVDKTWFSGASWVRPIFDCQGTGCASNQFGNIIWMAGNATTLDNIEMTGYKQSASGNLVGAFGNDNEIENMYMHGWSRTAGSSGVNSFALSNNFSSGGALRTKMHDNVIDGSDSPNQDFFGGILHGDQVYNNVVRFVYNGMNGNFNDVHGNLVENNFTATSGDHCNMIFVQAPFTGTTVYVYNNVVRHGGLSCSGSTLWILGNASCSTCNSFVYNNVLYDNEGDFDSGITIGSHPAQGGTGTYFVDNNTIDTPRGPCVGNGESPPRSVTHYANMHCITSGVTCGNTGTTCTNDGGNLQQTEAVANAAGYTAGQTYAYSPIAANSPTVGAGTNLTGSCTGSVTALCSDTTYATYDTVNHAVVLRIVNARPGAGAWDTGAYEFAGGSPGTVATPSITPPSGTYVGPVNVTLSTATIGATLCYTTDGSSPTANGSGTCTHGNTYVGAINVSIGQTIIAIGSAPGFLDSAAASTTYGIQPPAPSSMMVMVR